MPNHFSQENNCRLIAQIFFTDSTNSQLFLGGYKIVHAKDNANQGLVLRPPNVICQNIALDE
jgi:hypothetical protein